MIDTPMTPSVLARKCRWLLKNGDPHKAKAYRVLTRLVKRKLVRKFRDQYEVTTAGEKGGAKSGQIKRNGGHADMKLKCHHGVLKRNSETAMVRNRSLIQQPPETFH